MGLNVHTTRLQQRLSNKNSYRAFTKMFAFLERRVGYMYRVRETRRAEQAARRAFEENCRNARIKLCPGCQVPIEKNDGCDHMHCVICGRHFSWRSAIPYNLEALENSGDGRFRYCPHCQYQNIKLHCLSEVRCSRCERDFIWETARIVPVTTLPREFPQTRHRAGAVGGENDCGAVRAPPQHVSTALRAWLNDARRRPRVGEELPHTPNDVDNPVVVHETLRCQICSSRSKSHALQCGHLFCEECLVICLRQHPTCPVDRTLVELPPIRIYL